MLMVLTTLVKQPKLKENKQNADFCNTYHRLLEFYAMITILPKVICQLKFSNNMLKCIIRSKYVLD